MQLDLAGTLAAEKELTATLLESLKRERESILAGKIEDLYEACRRRTELIERLRSGQEATARAIAGLTAGGTPGTPNSLTEAINRLSKGARPRLRRLQAEVNRLRKEVTAVSRENARYATEALDYLEAAVAILTGADMEPATYGERRPKAGPCPAVISSEV